MGFLDFLLGRSGPEYYEVVLERTPGGAINGYRTQAGDWEPLANVPAASGDSYTDATGRAHIRVGVDDPAQLQAWAERQQYPPELHKVDSLYVSEETREDWT